MRKMEEFIPYSEKTTKPNLQGRLKSSFYYQDLDMKCILILMATASKSVLAFEVPAMRSTLLSLDLANFPWYTLIKTALILVGAFCNIFLVNVSGAL